MLLAACSCAASELPWWVAWVPVFSAVIGLISGVTGVLIGAWLRERDEARRWRLEQRNAALLVFAQRADAYLRTLTRYFAPQVAGNTTAADVLEAMYGLDGAGTIVQMMSPLTIRTAVRAIMNYVTDGIMPFTLPGAPAVPQDQMQTMLSTLVARFGAFVEVARADFGEA